MKKRKNLPSLYSSSKLLNGLGLGILRDVVEANVTEERNGMFELELGVKKDGFLVDRIKTGSIIKANASKTLRNQLFRVYNIKKSDNDNLIWIYAEHIFFDLRHNLLRKMSYRDMSPNYVLGDMFKKLTQKNNFIGSSDNLNTYAFDFDKKNALECIVGSQGSIIDVAGGELLRDNYNVRLLKKRGRDNNVLVAYKKNILGFDCVEDISDLCTKIYPYAMVEKELETVGNNENNTSNLVEELIEIDELYIEASNIGDYDVEYIRPVDFTDDEFFEKYAINKENLKILSSKYFTKTKCNIPKFSYKINLIALSETEEYKDLAFLEDIELCDIVNVWHSVYNVREKVRVNSIKFDVLRDRITEIELNNETSTIHNGYGEKFDEIEKVINSNKTEMEKVIEKVSQQITGNDGGYVKLYPPDRPSEIFILDVDDVNLAKNVMRINKSGIGFSKNGLNGKYETGWSSDGVFFANWIQAGVFNANLIKTGVLSNKNGTISIDMENGSKVLFRRNGNRALEIDGALIRFFDYETDGVMTSGEVFAGRMTTGNKEKTLTICNMIDSVISLGYRDGTNNGIVYSYILLDKYKKVNPYPVTIFEEVLLKNGAVLDNDRVLYLHSSKVPCIFRASSGHIIFQSDIYGMKLTNANGYTMLGFEHTGTINVGANYHFPIIPLSQGGGSSVFANSAGEAVLDGATVAGISVQGRYALKTDMNRMTAYKDLDMNQKVIYNANIVTQLYNTKTRSVKEVKPVYSISDEISTTHIIKTNKNGFKIDLESGLNYGSYVVNCTPDENVKVWVKKYEDYCMVFAEDDCNADVVIMYRMLENTSQYMVSTDITNESRVYKDDRIDSVKDDIVETNSNDFKGFCYEVDIENDENEIKDEINFTEVE